MAHRADYFLIGKDLPSYMECREKVDDAYSDQKVPRICKKPVKYVATWVPEVKSFLH